MKWSERRKLLAERQYHAAEVVRLSALIRPPGLPPRPPRNLMEIAAQHAPLFARKEAAR